MPMRKSSFADAEGVRGGGDRDQIPQSGEMAMTEDPKKDPILLLDYSRQTLSQLRVEEFRHLRGAIAENMRENITNERYALIGLAVYYGWLFTHPSPITENNLEYVVAWGVPSAVPLLGLWRAYENIGHVWELAWYILELEKEEAIQGRPIGPDKGWEHFLWKNVRKNQKPELLSRLRRNIIIQRSTSSLFFWILLTGVCGCVLLFALAARHLR